MAFDGQLQLPQQLVSAKHIKASLTKGWLVDGQSEGFLRGLVKGECLFTVDQKLVTSGEVIAKNDVPSFPRALLIHPRLKEGGWIVRALISNKFDLYESITVGNGIVLTTGMLGALQYTGTRFWAVADREDIKGKLLESNVSFLVLKYRCGLAL